MGCVQGKSSMYSPPQSLEKLKRENRYVKGEDRGSRPIGLDSRAYCIRFHFPERSFSEMSFTAFWLSNFIGFTSFRCSSPEDYWKIMRLPTSFRLPQYHKPSFQEAFKNFPESSFGLLTTLLALNQANRGTAASAL
ncbi:hypothetical protein SADUNF_Sadunf05G0060300 [Salix dunnii]|uniref:Uncharacterized protein n=1 Tax=Salix dunnii TaxID=1413687 RepID=A0A835K9V0_9ROSI|nr:hypothetical protein SADUNF_Sadunf05G0060300 [Salix dunnii]